MINVTEKNAVDIDAIRRGLAKLAPSKRQQIASDFAVIAAEVLIARELKKPWSAILKHLNDCGLKISAARAKILLKKHIDVKSKNVGGV